MTGPEHYQEAELLLTGDSAVCEYGCPHSGCPHEMQLIARAQVHATLALAAAAALNDGDGGMGAKDYDAWRRMASVSPLPTALDGQR